MTSEEFEKRVKEAKKELPEVTIAKLNSLAMLLDTATRAKNTTLTEAVCSKCIELVKTL